MFKISLLDINIIEAQQTYIKSDKGFRRRSMENRKTQY